MKFADGRVLYEFALSEEDKAAIASGANVNLWLWTGDGRPQPVGLCVTGEPT